LDTLRRDTCSKAWFRGLYALVKDIYRLAEAFAGMKRMNGSSRKGLSPLLAIIIGLVVTVVAGILLAQLYFSYAATISARPAANIEYVDLIENGDNDILVISIKNTGSVPITQVRFGDASGLIDSYDVTIEPGRVKSITYSGALTNSAGEVWNGNVTVVFSEGSVQVYAISVRSRTA